MDPRSTENAALSRLLGGSPAMQQLRRQIRMFGAIPIPIVLVGKTGTGKELVAEALHAESRLRGAMVAVNCANLQESLAESLLFGHEAGAFTDARRAHTGFLAEANNGTLFLDEIAELPAYVQSKLLRALENGEYRPLGASRLQRSTFRIVAATSRDMPTLVHTGEFRRDLFYRLGAVQIQTPSLRHRTADIPQLATHFLTEFAGRTDNPVPELSSKSIDLLMAQRWPGNLRQLRAVIEASFAFVEDGVIREGDLEELLRNLHLPPADASKEGPESASLSLEEILVVREREVIEDTLSRTGGSVGAAALLLKMSKPTLYRRIRELGIGSPGRSKARKS